MFNVQLFKKDLIKIIKRRYGYGKRKLSKGKKL